MDWGAPLLAALTFHINVLEAHRGYLPANWDILWSLSVEEMFYLAFPLLCRVLGRGQSLMGLLLAFAVMGPFARTAFAHGNEVWQEYSYLGSMDAIALGCLTAMLAFARPWPQRVLRVLGILGTTILVFIFGFSIFANSIGLGRSGINMSLLALGTCMIAAAASQSGWRSPRFLGPLLLLGQRSYEIYLTHMFVVFALFDLFVFGGKSLGSVPFLFVATIFCAAVLGDLVARFYSEPMNWLLRRRMPERLGRSFRRLQFQRRQLLLGESLDITGHAEQLGHAALQLLLPAGPALQGDRALRFQLFAHFLEGAVDRLELLGELRRSQIVVDRLHFLALAGRDQPLLVHVEQP